MSGVSSPAKLLRKKRLPFTRNAKLLHDFKSLSSYGKAVGEQEINTNVTLFPSYPNPFNPITHISFSLPEAQQVKISVFDLSGQEVAVLMDENKAAGKYSVMFNASGISSGTYIVHMQTGNISRSQRVTLIK